MNYAIILSGGVGNRMGGDIPKQYIEINGKPIIIYTIEKFINISGIDNIVIVAATQWHRQIEEWLIKCGMSNKKRFCFALPGNTRQESVLNGLSACFEFNIDENDGVIVHDAVRPMVNPTLIDIELESLKNYDAVMPVLPVNDTIYCSDNGNIVTGLLNRDTLFAGQAPEAYRLKRYYDIHSVNKNILHTVRGSSELAFKSGLCVKMIKGDVSNFKITTREDLIRFKQAVKEHNESI